MVDKFTAFLALLDATSQSSIIFLNLKNTFKTSSLLGSGKGVRVREGNSLSLLYKLSNKEIKDFCIFSSLFEIRTKSSNSLLLKLSKNSFKITSSLSLPISKSLLNPTYQLNFLSILLIKASIVRI